VRDRTTGDQCLAHRRIGTACKEAGFHAGEIAVRLEDIELAKPLYSSVQISAAVGVASGAFCISQWRRGTRDDFGRNRWRDWPVVPGLAVTPTRHQLRCCGIVCHCRFGIYVLAAGLARRAGLEFLHYPSGFIASVLFLIPGFPLIAALFDLLQHQTVAAISRFAYGAMLLLAVALGLSIVIEVGNVDITRQPPLDLAYPLKVLLRAIASFVAACAFRNVF
jgi:hypothetical protein